MFSVIYQNVIVFLFMPNINCQASSNLTQFLKAWLDLLEDKFFWKPNLKSHNDINDMLPFLIARAFVSTLDAMETVPYDMCKA